jgi:gliding motility-associated-like protein
VKYYRSNGTQIVPFPNPFFVTGTETITIRVSNNTTQTAGDPCNDEVQLQFIVDDRPEAFAIDPILTSICDDEPNPIDQDGLIDFDTSTFLNTIIGAQTGLNVYYYDQNNVLIPSTTPNQLPNPFRTGTQNVKVVVENPINTSCPAQLIIPFIVNPTPKIDQQEKVVICLPDTEITLDAGILDGTPTSNYTYTWYFNNAIITGQTNPTLIVNTTGIYKVEVTNAFNCSKTRTITVISSQAPTNIEIDVVDLSDFNSITVNLTGSGTYEFAIDDVNGPYQSSNIFNNVPIGFHEIYVRDRDGCGSVGPILVSVLGIPKYFTPNGDGYNDYWNVKGVSALINFYSTIYIFDRFGKLLKQLGTTSLGWDGTYNGRQMPADDYWYSIQFEDGRSAKGHFALKR